MKTGSFWLLFYVGVLAGLTAPFWLLAVILSVFAVVTLVWSHLFGPRRPRRSNTGFLDYDEYADRMREV